MKAIFSLRHHPSFRIFLLMFSIVCLLNINSDILRSARNTLAVTDLGGSAALIPQFELYGTLPAAILMTWFISWLMKRWSIQKVFVITLTLFLSFFLLFGFGLYPLLASWQKVASTSWVFNKLVTGFSMIFYVMGELWKVSFLAVLFWGLVNQFLAIDEAKRFYGPLMMGGSIGAILAGPLISLCTSDLSWRLFPLAANPWAHTLNLLILVICFIGVLAGFLYLRLWRLLDQRLPVSTTKLSAQETQEKFSLKECLTACFRSPYLLFLAWVVFADYLAYSLGEVVFFDVLKERYPDPRNYCHYMGQLSLWTGLTTFFSSLIITPLLLKRYKWVVTSVITPFTLMVTGIAFFLIFCQRSTWQSGGNIFGLEWIEVILFLGSLQYCLCRSAKYTLFDSSKELAFVMLPDISKMQGKLIIDGIGARFGRGSASFLSILIIHALGGVKASAFFLGIIAIFTAFSSTIATFRLGKLVDKRQRMDETLPASKIT